MAKFYCNLINILLLLLLLFTNKTPTSNLSTLLLVPSTTNGSQNSTLPGSHLPRGTF